MKPIAIVQNCPTESPGNLADYLDGNSIPYRVIRTFDSQALPPAGGIEAAIVLGTPISLLEYGKHGYLKCLYAFVAEVVRADIPVLGVGYGGQLLARLLGADVVRNDVREIGLYAITLTDEGRKDRLFAGLGPNLEVFQWHADAFMIPHGATLLTTGETCRNQAFRKNNAVGVQFHPEPGADEIPLWCDEYADELAEEGLSKQEIVSAYGENAAKMQQFSHRLVRNFLG